LSRLLAAPTKDTEKNAGGPGVPRDEAEALVAKAHQADATRNSIGVKLPVE
jgi:hypothetical protein